MLRATISSAYRAPERAPTAYGPFGPGSTNRPSGRLWPWRRFHKIDVDVCLHGFVRWPDNVYVAVHIYSYGFIVLYVHLYVSLNFRKYS